MKKALLVLALPLMIVGCKNQSTKNWISLRERQTLTVFVGTTTTEFSLGYYDFVDFYANYTTDGCTTIEIKTSWTREATVIRNYFYKGSNVSYLLYTFN